jgi:hypothetical protein
VADFSTDYVTLNSMPTATAASNAKVTPNPIDTNNRNACRNYAGSGLERRNIDACSPSSNTCLMPVITVQNFLVYRNDKSVGLSSISRVDFISESMDSQVLV